MASYNSALKAEYLSGSYKDPYYYFTTLNVKDFDVVAVNAASEISVVIKHGSEHKVQVRKDDMENIKVKQNANTLVVDVTYPRERRDFDSRERVVITLPQLKSVKADGTYMLAGKQKIIRNSRDEKSWTTVRINDFNQDSLYLEQNNINKVELTGNKLGVLRAITGKNTASESTLVIAKNNTINQANLDIRYLSKLNLENIAIPKLTYQFSDSAQVNISGRL
jgi:hypothetical protein